MDSSGGWRLDRQVKKLHDQRTERTLTWTDPKTRLVLRWAAIEYHDFPTAEWTLNSWGQETRPLAFTDHLSLGLHRVTRKLPAHALEKNVGLGDRQAISGPLEECHRLGAGGRQVPLGVRDQTYLNNLRKQAER